MTRANEWVLLILMASLAGCRGQPSASPPVHLNPNMDSQEKYKAQSYSHFFADRRTMRNPPEGTVAVGHLKDDDALFRGMTDGKYVATIPVEVTAEFLKRGQQRYNIYCAPCHDQTGSGAGPVATRAGLMPPPTSYHQERIRQMPDGELFGVISNGVRTMSSYRSQLDERDRWAVVAYIRALQRSQNASLTDVPEPQRTTLQ